MPGRSGHRAQRGKIGKTQQEIWCGLCFKRFHGYIRVARKLKGQGACGSVTIFIRPSTHRKDYNT